MKNLYKEHPLYGRMRACRITFYLLRRELGDDSPVESTLNRHLRGITVLPENLESRITKIVEKYEKEWSS